MAEERDANSTVILGAATPQPAQSAIHQNALPIGAKLGEFEIIDLVGEGGFGIVYLAQDHSLHRKVALKEYMPASLASRGHDASVSVRSERHRETFGIGLRSFVNEARILAQFDHAALVKVYRFWEANGTAYMVMPFYSGQTLQDALRARDDAPEEAWIRKILSPVMDALAIIHEEQIYHRDIAPDNIMLLAGDRPVLLDFGAARRVISDMTQALTVILKPGYAPIEQYAEMPGMKQGPWTDVYALAAVVYFMILNRKPPPAVGRMMQDSYEPLMLSEMAGRYSDQFLQGIDRCLNVKAEDRPQSIAAMREAIGFTTTSAAPAHHAPARPVAPPPVAAPSAAPSAAPKPAPKPAPKAVAKPVPATATDHADEPKASKLPLIIGAAVVVAAVAGGAAYYATQKKAASPSPATIAAPQVTPAVKAPPPPVATPAPVPRFTSLTAAIDGALAAADPRFTTTLDTPATITVGSDLKLTAYSKADSLLYLFLWDQATDKIYRLTPSEKDADNAIKANGSFAIPRKDSAKFAAREPLGTWRVIAMTSEKPRDFSKTPFARDGDFLQVERGVLEAKLATDGLASLFGTPQCAAASCADHFALSVANITKEAAPAPVVKPTVPAPKPATPQATPSPSKKAPDSEREYMKRLNKDLDNLLGK
ncbi:protein kinase [Uliginosibacterium sp. H3]|uniref:non-specific serine/threonine protein kinase n=1 Tax=Uliginosibacterium silvisoli TaxID=3114758 RepID=A0ABU6K4K5_9RHOO|nr:protein kinase [Uliginosibacterium sp. H3]